MDPQQIKHTALMLSVGVAALSLMTSLPALLGGRPRHPAALGAALAALAGGLAMAAICGIVGLRLPPGTGGRGAALMLGLGALAAPLATFVGARGSRDDDAENAPPSAAWSLMPGIVVIGFWLITATWLATRYGIAARTQMACLTCGTALGLAWSVLVLRARSAWPAAESLCGSLSGGAIAAVTLAQTLDLATHHYPSPATEPWFVLFCGVGLAAGWALSLTAVAFLGNHGGRGASVVSALLMAFSLFLVAGSAQAHLVKSAPLLAGVEAGFLGALLLFGLCVKQEETPPDGFAAPATVMLLAALAWVGFKLQMGLGVAVAALGFIAAWPSAASLGAAGPVRFGMPVAQRFAALSAAALTLLASFRAFQEAADLSLSGIDISDGNVLMALITGLGLPVVLESIYGRHPAGATPQAQSVTRAALDAGLRLAGSTLTSALALVFMLVFAGNAGAACLVLGMAMWGVVAAAAMAASAVEAGLPTWRSMPSALVTATLAPLALPWRDTLSDVTRAQKLLMVNSLTAAGLVWILLAALQRRQSAPAETPPDAEASSD